MDVPLRIAAAGPAAFGFGAGSGRGAARVVNDPKCRHGT